MVVPHFRPCERMRDRGDVELGETEGLNTERCAAISC